MKKLTDYFEKTYIVSLPDKHNLRQQTIEEFNLVGWNIDNSRINFFDAIRPDDRLNFASIGARGCYESHLQLIKKFLSSTSDNCGGNLLIFEDDISFEVNLSTTPETVAEILERNDFDIFYFGFKSSHIKPPEDGLEIFSPSPGTPIRTTHFYALHRRCLKNFIAHLEGILCGTHPESLGHMHYDGAISWFRKLNPDLKTFVCNPSLGSQRPSRSLISSDTGFMGMLPRNWIDISYNYYTRIQRFSKSIKWNIFGS